MESLIALILFGVLAAVLFAGWRRGRFALAFAAVAAILLGFWAASMLAISTDYRDADGHMDCWPSCTTYQDAVGGAFWYSIPALMLLGVGSGIVIGVSALRRRAAHRPG